MRQLTGGLIVVLGLGLVALTPALSLLARACDDRCPWTCYTPAHSPASDQRVVGSLTRWHVRPSLGLVVIDALGASSVDLVRAPPHSLYSVQSSPLLVVPIVGVVLTLGALILSRAGPLGIYGDGRGETKSRR